MIPINPPRIDVGTRSERALQETFGIVDFSQLDLHPIGPTLTLRLVGNPDEFWIRGNYRIDVGERIRILFDKNGTSPYVTGVFEILSRSGGVIQRYVDCTRGYDFS